MADAIVAAVSDELEAVLKPLGYKKSRNVFRREVEGMTWIVEIQRSRDTLPSGAKLTINIGVYSEVLAQKYGTTTRKPKTPDCQWWQRLGEMMPIGRDEWWIAPDPAGAHEVGRHLGQLITQYGTPALERVGSLQKLCEYWRSGGYGGLTETQRKRYLDACS